MKKKILTIFTFILLIIAAAVIDGMSYMFLWNWFVSPLGFLKLNFWHGFGLSLFVGVVLLGLQKVDSGNKTEDIIITAISKFIIQLLMVGIGAIVALLI